MDLSGSFPLSWVQGVPEVLIWSFNGWFLWSVDIEDNYGTGFLTAFTKCLTIDINFVLENEEAVDTFDI